MRIEGGPDAKNLDCRRITLLVELYAHGDGVGDSSLQDGKAHG